MVAFPRMLTPFQGREALVTTIVDRLTNPAVRLLTLTGPGGVGKTRLALHSAEIASANFAEGMLFVPLATVFDPALVLPAIAKELGLAHGDERPLFDRMVERLATRQILLVLDNLEQVLSASLQISRLLRATHAVTVLATSRSLLNIDGEQELVIPPLTTPTHAKPGQPVAESEGVHFFLDRARAANPNLTLSPESALAVDEIVRRLDGLPLALELAAARTKVLSPQALLVRIVRKVDVLTGGPTDRPARQRTMRDAIAWSYELLSSDEQRLFRSLAVFRGGFTLDDATAALADSADPSHSSLDILDGVTALVNQSLLTTNDRDGDEVRFRMLETIREFGLEQLALQGEADMVQTRFAEHWTAMAEDSWSHAAELVALNQALAPLERNHDNVRAALDWLEIHDIAGAAKLAGALSWLWYLHGHHAEALRRLRRLLALPESAIPESLKPRLVSRGRVECTFSGRHTGSNSLSGGSTGSVAKGRKSVGNRVHTTRARCYR